MKRYTFNTFSVTFLPQLYQTQVRSSSKIETKLVLKFHVTRHVEIKVENVLVGV